MDDETNKARALIPAHAATVEWATAFFLVLILLALAGYIMLRAVDTGNAALGFIAGLGLIGMTLSLTWSPILQPLVAGLRVGAPQVWLSANTFRLGDELTIRSRLAFRRVTAVTSFSIQLVLGEMRHYGSRVRRRTRYRYTVVAQCERPGREYESGEVFENTCSLRIPDSGLHTYLAGDVYNRWYVRLHVAMPGWPDFMRDYPITVVPKPARRD